MKKFELTDDEYLAVVINLHNYYNAKGISDETLHMTWMEDCGYSVYN